MQYDVFISYRRDGGDMVAHILYEKLSQRGYSVFQDIERLRSGKFNTALLSIIEQCKDFLLVLPPHSLDRCQDKDDWVRNEIECAIHNNKNIVPIMLRGFQWPDTLPEEIEQIRYYNGISANTEYFEQFLEKLDSFLESAKTQKKKPKHSRVVKNALLLSLGGMTLICPILLSETGHIHFGLLPRIVYFAVVLMVANFALLSIETKPEIAELCFGSLTEEDLFNHPNVIYSVLTSTFGKKQFILRESREPFTDLYLLKRMVFGTWDGKRTNYLKIYFRNTFEWYDPSVFYIHTLSKGSAAVQMLTRQGFLLQSTPSFLKTNSDYLVKDSFHVFLFYRNNRLDYVEVFQCNFEEIKQNYNLIKEVILDDEVLEE